MFEEANYFRDFNNLWQLMSESSPSSNDGKLVNQLFEFIEEHFEECFDSKNRDNFLLLVDRCLRASTFNAHRRTNDIGPYLQRMWRNHKTQLPLVLQIVCQVMNTLQWKGPHVLQVGDQLFLDLIDMLNSIREDRKLCVNILACLQLYMRKFDEQGLVKKTLWTHLKHRIAMSIAPRIDDVEVLVQMFEDFAALHLHHDFLVLRTVKLLLKSELCEERKYGYHLLQKISNWPTQNADTCPDCPSDMSIEAQRCWMSFILILKNLDAQQSHLILPSLETVTDMRSSGILEQDWLDILYLRILQHNNILVVRWAIEYFLRTHPSSALSKPVLHQLLLASNLTALYNCEGYFLSTLYFKEFLNGNQTLLYEVLGDVNWKPVPLHVWMTQLVEHIDSTQQAISIPYECILRICSRVRALQNRVVRQHTIEQVELAFANLIDQMPLKDYIVFVETLYNSTDQYKHLALLKEKIEKCPKSEMEAVIFSKRLHDIVCKNSVSSIEIIYILSCLSTIPKQCQGWLRFMIFANINSLSEASIKILKNHCNLDLESLKLCTLSNVICEFNKALIRNCDKEEQSFIRTLAVNYYIIYILKDLNTLESDDLKRIFDEGSMETLNFLSDKLKNVKNVLESWILEEFVKGVVDAKENVSETYCCNIVLNVLSYIERVQGVEEMQLYADKFITDNCENIGVCEAVAKLKDFNVTQAIRKKLLTCGDAKTGDSRIEEAYEYYQFNRLPKYSSVRNVFLGILMRQADMLHIELLLEFHKEVSAKKARYFANSKEHRIKLRIACSLLCAITNHRTLAILDSIWDILLTENNQLNVTYIYEFIVGLCEQRYEMILHRLEESIPSTVSHQVSVIAATYHYCLLNELTVEQLTAIISKLLPRTMGAHFQTRLYSQIVIYKILQNPKYKDKLSYADLLLHSIETATGDRLGEYLNDVRVHLVDFYDSCKRCPLALLNCLMYVTNTPYDECFFDKTKSPAVVEAALQEQLEKSRKVFSRKLENIANQSENVTDENTNIVNTEYIQRKMNPPNDILQESDLITYLSWKSKSEMYVVASLIDKLPNLGGIARTCEVLGIQNLVIQSKSYVETADFKNLSMTAEKSLTVIEVKAANLKEFLMRKQMEGYQIVGAEQTTNSKSFANFAFPRKCILLLGHEKDGIPAQLLSCLDHAVEIPQIGNVRSLNVHVTAALFMWEYCKQHLIR